ncbi:MAG: hypothetical protein AB1631_34150 [Acidobacteriota bacterium]
MATTATSITASGKTGGICSASGPYRSGRNTSVIVYFKKGDKFTVDPTDGRGTTWSLVRE